MKRVFIALVVVTSSVFGFVTTAWQAEWAEVVAAAKREGKVVVIGPQGTETREALTEGFQRKYPEIQVEHSGAAGAQLPPKLLAEQKSERYSVDLLVQGTTTVITGLMMAKAVIPIQPFLVGPNTQDTSVWLNKKFSFADEAGQYNLVLALWFSVETGPKQRASGQPASAGRVSTGQRVDPDSGSWSTQLPH